MSTYCDKWRGDFANIFYDARELMKRDAYEKMTGPDVTLEEKVSLAEQVIKSHFLRSAYAWMENDRQLRHPSFREYAAMLLNQDSYRELFEDEVADALVQKYGRKEGIPDGTYYPPKA